MLTVYDEGGHKLAEAEEPDIAALLVAYAGKGATIRGRMRVPGHPRGVVLYRADGEETMDGCDLARIGAAVVAEARRLMAEHREMVPR